MGSKTSAAEGGALAGAFRRAGAAIAWIENAGSVMAGGAIFLVMLIVFIDVFMRYQFRAPLSWSYDLISLYMVPILFFLVVSETFRRNHHVAVDIAYLRFSDKGRRVARLLIALLMAPAVWQIVSLSAQEAAQSYARKEAISGAVLWPTWIPLVIVTAGFGLLLARLALDAAALILALSSGLADVPGESAPRQSATSHDEALP
jgi:TRAP-type C4-dicarboxylate transport system permease small subunit